MRKEILEVAKSNGELAQAEALVGDLDRALIELGELALEVERSGIGHNADFCERMKSESLEVRQAAERFRGISDTSNQLADLFTQLADWLEEEFRMDEPGERRLPPDQANWN